MTAHIGTVTYVDHKKGYGYVKDSGGTSYCINQKALEYALQSDWKISKGDTVSFTDYVSRKGTHYANNITKTTNDNCGSQ